MGHALLLSTGLFDVAALSTCKAHPYYHSSSSTGVLVVLSGHGIHFNPNTMHALPWCAARQVIHDGGGAKRVVHCRSGVIFAG